LVNCFFFFFVDKLSDHSLIVLVVIVVVGVFLGEIVDSDGLGTALENYIASNNQTTVTNGVWIINQSGPNIAPPAIRAAKSFIWSIVHMAGADGASIDAITVEKPDSFVPPELRGVTSTIMTGGSDTTQDTSPTTTINNSSTTTSSSLDNNAKPTSSTSGLDSTYLIIIIVAAAVICLCLIIVIGVVLWKKSQTNEPSPSDNNTRATELVERPNLSGNYQQFASDRSALAPPSNYTDISSHFDAPASNEYEELSLTPIDHYQQLQLT
jgi:hypothetical protein